MSATYRLFERWRAKKGYKSERQAILALGLSGGAITHWKDGRNGHPDIIERMAHDLGEDPVRTILEAYAEQEKGQSARVLEKLSKRFAAVVLTSFMLLGATANTNEFKGLFASISHSIVYIMSNLKGLFRRYALQCAPYGRNPS